METKELFVNILSENLAEAEFMCANFIDNEVKNRAFVNVLGAEAVINYLSENDIDTDYVRNLHSVKRILEKTNIADIILSNIHIDVRVVFERNEIFIPKSHFELGIKPDVYMVLKFDSDYKQMENLGYILADKINKENSSEDYYFVDISELSAPEGFIDFVKNYTGNTEKDISEQEMFRGRELSILASDDDITNDEYAEFLQLMSSSIILRDSVLEYDNFETLAGRVAGYMHDNPDGLQSDEVENAESEGNIADDENLIPENDSESLEIQDLNGDELLDDDNFSTESLDVSNNISDISDVGVSDEAIELAGLAGDIEGVLDETANEDSSSMDIGTADFDLDSADDNDDMSVDLFDNIEHLDTDINEDADTLLDSGELPSEENIGDLELESQDLSDFADSTEEESINADENNEEFPTEAFEDLEAQDLDIEQDDLLGGDIDLSADDMLMQDDENSAQEEENLTDMDVNSDEEQAQDENNPSLSEYTTYAPENVEVSSYQNYNPIDDEHSGKTGVTASEQTNLDAESFDFSDLEVDAGNQEEEILKQNELDKQESADDLYDFASLNELTEEPVDSSQEPFEDVSISDFDDFADGSNQTNDEAEEVIISDDFLNNTVVMENSTVISDKNFEPGEILLDINKTSLPDFGDDSLGNLYDQDSQAPQSGLNNDVRIGSMKNLSISSIPKKYGIIGLALVVIIAGVIAFSVTKMNSAKEEAQPLSGSLNPENNASDDNLAGKDVSEDDVLMKDDDVKTANLPSARNSRQAEAEAQNLPSKPIPPTAFMTIKKLSWEVPDYVSYSADFRQFFQSSGRALKTALSSDLLLATDYTYSNIIKLSVTFDKNGKFKDAKIVTSSGSANVDKIVLQSVNQTLNILKAPNSLGNDENTTVILKINL